ncbi:hypothetical protein U1Q18_025802 [Sarracenia purpurea var. burkii]
MFGDRLDNFLFSLMIKVEVVRCASAKDGEERTRRERYCPENVPRQATINLRRKAATELLLSSPLYMSASRVLLRSFDQKRRSLTLFFFLGLITPPSP